MIYDFIICKLFRIEKQKTTTEQKDLFFHETGISTSKFNPKVKEGDKCLFKLAKGID